MGRRRLNRTQYKKARKLARHRAEEQDHLCFWCAGSIDYTETAKKRALSCEHVFPLSKGGKNVKENIVAAHAKCNMDKGNAIPTYDEIAKAITRLEKKLGRELVEHVNG